MPILRTNLTILLVWALSGCDHDAPKDITPESLETPVVQRETASHLGLADGVCQSKGRGSPQIFDARMTRWSSGQLAQNTIDIRNLGISGSPLSGPSTSRVMIDAVFRRSCDSRLAAPPRCDVEGQSSPGWRQTAPGNPLIICSSSPSPPRQSIEHQALAAFLTVERAAQIVGRHMPANQTIPPLTILVSPRFESLWTPWEANGASGAYETLFVDNLAYFAPTLSTPPYLALLPTSLNNDALFLWEIPFVVTHEFGHHVEHALGIDHFSTLRSHIRRAVSEGFADLIGFAAHGTSDVDPLVGIPCLAADRSPASALFSGGAAKTISPNLLQQIDASKSHAVGSLSPHVLSSRCQGVSPYSAHGLGAILAFIVRDLALQTPNFQSDPTGNLIKIAIHWLQQTEINMGSGSATRSAEQETEATARALELTITKTFADSRHSISDLTRETLRQKMRSGFAGISRVDWFHP
jgi:hypothetical protein